MSPTSWQTWAIFEVRICIHDMHKLKHSVKNCRHIASIVPLYSIWRSVHLFPKFDKEVPEDWISDSVLEKCNMFYLNQFVDRNMHFILWILCTLQCILNWWISVLDLDNFYVMSFSTYLFPLSILHLARIHNFLLLSDLFFFAQWSLCFIYIYLTFTSG